MTRKTILIVDDEADIRNLVKEILEDEGYATLTAANSKQAYEILEMQKPDMAVLDIWLQDSRHDGLQILETIKAGEHASIPVIMISGHGTIETAVNAIKQGAYDFIEKPFKSDRLILMVRRGLEAASLQQENAALRAQNRDIHQSEIIGSSLHAKQIRDHVKTLGVSQSRLLIEGPLGVGKTTIAKLIHDCSASSGGAFCVYACAQDANKRIKTKDAIANTQDGTIVFQDINLLDAEEQKEMLNAIQADTGHSRIITTLQNREGIDDTLVKRLSIESIVIPSLAERKHDISDLLHYFTQQISLELGMQAPVVNVDAVKICEKYSWPGNLHELKAVVLCSLVHGKGEISLSTLPAKITGVGIDANNIEVLNVTPQNLDDAFLELPLRDARDVFEREYLTSQVERFEGNISKTAQFVGMERSALHRKIKSLQEKDIQEEPTEAKNTSAMK